MKKLISILLGFLLIGCQQKTDTATADAALCTCPPVIALQPCNGFTQAEAKRLIPALQRFIKDYSGVDLDFDVLPPVKLPDELKVTKTKYGARGIITKLSKEKHANGYYVVVALTHDDIATNHRGQKNWGILGLAIHALYTCVASDHRLRNPKRDYWKVVAHEFIHTYHGYSHCPKDDVSCIMKDAKGKADFSNKSKLCNTCRQALNK